MSKKRSKREKIVKPAPARYSVSALIGVGAGLVFGLLGSLIFYQIATADSRVNSDSFQVGFQHVRLRQLVAELPPESIVGYVSDLPVGGAEDLALFLGARYVLAPRLLVRADSSAKPEWVLGNFYRNVDPAPYAAGRHLRVAKIYGPGVVLFQRESR